LFSFFSNQKSKTSFVLLKAENRGHLW